MHHSTLSPSKENSEETDRNLPYSSRHYSIGREFLVEYEGNTLML